MSPKITKRLWIIAAILFVITFFIVMITPRGNHQKLPDRGSDISAASQTQATTGQKNALKQAKNYLDIMAFSYSGLIKQLEYEKYSTEDATYAADHCGADWNEQAAKKAKEYLDIMSFSRDGLITQLKYDGFTESQAEYGVEQNGY